MLFERAGIKRERQVSAAKQAKFTYGVDANGPVVYAKVESNRYQFHEELQIRDGNVVFLTRYNSNKGFPPWLEYTLQMVLGADGKPKHLISVHGQDRYTWREDKLVRIDTQSQYGRSHEELVYDVVGELDRVWRVSFGGRTLRYKRPGKGVNLKSLEKSIGGRLPAEIARTVTAARIKAPVYCLVLAYDGEGNDVLPPCLGIGLDSERQQWIRANGKDAKDLIWNPAEFIHYEKPHTQLKDKELDKACEMLNDALRPRDNFSPAVELLNNVATELGKMDWKGSLNTTADFVAFAVDFELGELKKNLKQSVPAAKLARLHKAGLL